MSYCCKCSGFSESTKISSKNLKYIGVTFLTHILGQIISLKSICYCWVREGSNSYTHQLDFIRKVSLSKVSRTFASLLCRNFCYHTLRVALCNYAISSNGRFPKRESIFNEAIYIKKFCCMISFANLKESLIVWSFKVKFLNKVRKISPKVYIHLYTYMNNL